MESKKTFRLLALIFSLLVIENSMASRILVDSYPPSGKDGSKIGASGSTPKQDGSHSGGSSGHGMVLVPPPATQTKISQAGQPNRSATAGVHAPANAKVNVSTSVSPTSATSSSSVTSPGTGSANSSSSASSYSSVHIKHP